MTNFPNDFVTKTFNFFKTLWNLAPKKKFGVRICGGKVDKKETKKNIHKCPFCSV